MWEVIWCLFIFLLIHVNWYTSSSYLGVPALPRTTKSIKIRENRLFEDEAHRDGNCETENINCSLFVVYFFFVCLFAAVVGFLRDNWEEVGRGIRKNLGCCIDFERTCSVITSLSKITDTSAIAKLGAGHFASS